MKGLTMIALAQSLRLRFSRYNILRRLQQALLLRRSRLHLARLDLRLLDDVGLTPRQQQQEAARRLWDAPDTWRDHGSGWR